MSNAPRAAKTNTPAGDPAETVAVVIVEPDGTARREDWAGPDGNLLDHLQQAVGGLVDAVSLTPVLDMWLNDEGMFRCEVNPIASVLAASYGMTQPYFGAAVFTGAINHRGSTTSLTAEQVTDLLHRVEVLRTNPSVLGEVAARAQRWLNNLQ
jgi:hypothetical protein